MASDKPIKPITGFYAAQAMHNWFEDCAFEDFLVTAFPKADGSGCKLRLAYSSGAAMDMEETPVLFQAQAGSFDRMPAEKKERLLRATKVLGYLDNKGVIDVNDMFFDIGGLPGLFNKSGPITAVLIHKGIYDDVHSYIIGETKYLQDIDLKDADRQPRQASAGKGKKSQAEAAKMAYETVKLDSLPKLETLEQSRDFIQSIDKKAREMIIGQDSAIHSLLIRIESYVRNEENTKPVLLCGPTGCGKTYSLKTLAELSGLPFVRIVIPDLSPATYRGANIQDVFYSEISGVMAKYDGYPERLLIQVDEFDKIVRRGEELSPQLQNEFLKLLEPDPKALSRNKNNDGVTSMPIRGLVMLSGAFSFMDYDFSAGMDCALLKKAGFIDELNGRIDAIVTLKRLEMKDFIAMLNADPPLPTIARELSEIKSLCGMDVRFEDETIELMAKTAEESGMGARHLDSTIRAIFDKLKHRMLFDDFRKECDKKKDLRDVTMSGELITSVTITPKFIPQKPKKPEKKGIGFFRI